MYGVRTMANYYSAVQAAARLKVSRQTLYAYVSRGLLRAHPGESHRDRRYLIAEVSQLATRRSRARSPRRVCTPAYLAAWQRYPGRATVE
jgi:citrate synthase